MLPNQDKQRVFVRTLFLCHAESQRKSYGIWFDAVYNLMEDFVRVLQDKRSSFFQSSPPPPPSLQSLLLALDGAIALAQAAASEDF